MTFGREEKLASGRTRGLQHHGWVRIFDDGASRLKDHPLSKAQEIQMRVIAVAITESKLARQASELRDKVLGKNSDFIQKTANRGDGKLIS